MVIKLDLICMNIKTIVWILLCWVSTNCLALEIEGFTPDKIVTYKTVGDVELKLHVFYPSGWSESDKRPAIVFFFGGGWVSGSPSQFYPHCEYFASRGMVGISAEYRIKKTHGASPIECVKDGKSAIRWVRHHADQLGVDPNEIVACGGSAGGHVAAATATVTQFDDSGDDISVSAVPNALVLFNPVFDNGPVGGWGHDRVKDYWQDISPAHNIKTNTPPTVIFLGKDDNLIPVSTAEAYKTKMEQLDIRCDLSLYEGQGHGFFNYTNPEYYQKTIAGADQFLVSLGFLSNPDGADVHAALSKPKLESDFQTPPREAGVRCWWWWLNGNVTKEAITKDLEAMHEKGFSGAMIFDAGGANQRGNAQVPAGPLFASPEWTELYLHALSEAKRLGLEIGLSIQSGWNLGGPNVTPDFAAKQLTWSEVQIEGAARYSQPLAMPSRRNGYYQDICVLAYPQVQSSKEKSYTVKASSHQPDYSGECAADGNIETFWVSSGTQPGQGPSVEAPEWLEISFDQPVTVSGMIIQGRKGFGPKQCMLLCRDNGKATKAYSLEDKDAASIMSFEPISGKRFRLVVEASYDTQPKDSRNVQIAEFSLIDSNGNNLLNSDARAAIQDLKLKSGFKELGGSAPDTRFLLKDHKSVPGEQDVVIADIQDITAKLSPDGILTWDVPAGTWNVLRFGYTLTNAHVSTYSGNWKGSVIDYLSKDAFNRYWNEIVDPLLKKAGPLAGTVLKQLETDSWECGGMNWSPGFAADFKNYCGYDPVPYLPVIAGKIVENRDVSNAFLADFRKTLGHCVSENHYKVFAERAAQYNLGIQPESAGPHAGPMDGIKNYSHSDIVMSEFWVPSPHRPTPEKRFFVKQASSAAHIYGKQFVGAESFTSVGPHWNDVLWQSQKPSMDHEYCSGLNMVFFHTFTCSPKEMGLPGQEYFAGTHINPQVTWWDYSDAFINYMNRIQSVVQQGQFVADVLYYYGDHVPNIAALKEADPAQAMPGYDYDVTNEDVLLKLKVIDGKIMVPGGIQYRLLALPDHKVLSLPALEKVDSLLRQGATVLGPKPERLVSLVGGATSQQRFHALAEQLWGSEPAAIGHRQLGKGRLIWGCTARQFLQSDGVIPDFEVIDPDNGSSYDYIHYLVEGADVYFVCNQTEESRSIKAAFRIYGKQPEWWNPITGDVRNADAFEQSDGRMIVPLQFDPYGSLLVVFRKEIPGTQQGTTDTNFPMMKTIQKITGPWQVVFDPEWGGPASVQFDRLIDWSKHDNPGIRYYSGKAVYKNTFQVSTVTKGKRYWLQLGDVKDVGIAAAKLNGKEMGITWTKPFRVEITDALIEGENKVEVTVVNSWRNRLVGDRGKPQDQRYTQTNITIGKDWDLLESGLLGPVELKSND
jgi:acetyl esterase/lipase